MKHLNILLFIFLSSSAFAGSLSASDVNKKALEILIKNASEISLEGDVRPEETFAQILASALVPGKDLTASVSNSCVYISYDGIYECHLTIKYKHTSSLSSETSIAYELWADASALPESLLLPKVRISRGD